MANGVTPGTYTNIDFSLDDTGVYGLGQKPTDMILGNVMIEDGGADYGVRQKVQCIMPTKTWFNNANAMLWAVSQAVHCGEQ